MNAVPVLFAMKGSVYHEFANADVFDEARDALTYGGRLSIVAHPPCRAWSRMRKFAKPKPGEYKLALWAVEKVRELGGVLEHPHKSLLWEHVGLPLPGEGVDEFGGYTVAIDQHAFGHPAQKRTWLYIVGVPMADLPAVPLVLGEPEFTVGLTPKQWRRKPACSKRWRSATPKAFAEWLLCVAALASQRRRAA